MQARLTFCTSNQVYSKAHPQNKNAEHNQLLPESLSFAHFNILAIAKGVCLSQISSQAAHKLHKTS